MRRHRGTGGEGPDSSGERGHARDPGKRTRSGRRTPLRVDQDAADQTAASKLPANCPPRIPQGIAIANLDIGHLQSWARDREIVTLPKGTYLEQFQVTTGPQGNYYGRLFQESPDRLGVSWFGKDRGTGTQMTKGARFFKATDDVVALRSQAGPALDVWSAPPAQVQTSGGGAQYYISPSENAKMTEIVD
jgi:hypothetical protein